MAEKARDMGGPRKELIYLMNLAIKENYFAQGLREHTSDDYFCVDIIMGIALPQNGQLPTFLLVNVIEELVTSTNSVALSIGNKDWMCLDFSRSFRKCQYCVT